MRPPSLEHDALPPRRVPLLGSAPTHAAEGAAATCAPSPLPLTTNVVQAGRQAGAPQAQKARRLSGVAAATAATADTSAAAAAAPDADGTPAVAHPRLWREAEAAAGGRDGGAVALQARRLLFVAAATVGNADTSAAAAAAPAADATPAVAHPRLLGAAAAAAGGRDGGAVAHQEGGRGGCGRSGFLIAGPTLCICRFAKPPGWTAPPTTAKVFHQEYG